MVFNDASYISTLLGLPVWLILVASIWSIIWKGLALWKAAAVKKQLIWFIVLLVVNTLGILEILYYFLFSEIKLSGKSGKRRSKKK